MNVIELTDNDREILKNKGISEDTIIEQIKRFIKGAAFRNIVRPCIPDDGIQHFSPDDQQHFLEFYEKKVKHLLPVKFVPASGAATRMFKDLAAYVEGIGSDDADKKIELLMENIHNFAFFDDLDQCLSKDGKNLSSLIKNRENATIVKYLISNMGLGYKHLPKGLLKFHSYPDHNRTSFEEHLVESSVYAEAAGKASLHFTVSEEHIHSFTHKFETIKEAYEKELQVSFDVSFSIQDPHTDTISVDENNHPFRQKDGTILMRPGGHGSLISNLNRIFADIIFIKNIDNVVPDRLKETTHKWKKILGGLLLYIQGHFFEYLEKFDKMLASGIYDENVINEALNFTREYLCDGICGRPDKTGTPKAALNYLKNKLNRPIRVCGMVVNRGEPGGGPFWVDEDDEPTVQIVETAEIDMSQKKNRDIVKASTHFNPVDLVVSFKTYKGNYFDLSQYVNHDAFFITHKTKDGRPITALEHPGLWNGAMWRWNTVFVEVPEETFNPVKTVFDLLRDSHLA